MKNFPFLIASVGLVLCLTYCKPGKNITNFDPTGLWSSVEDTNSYHEIMFKNNTITFQSDKFGVGGPYHYYVKGDSLYYFGMKCAISDVNCDSFILKSSENIMILEKIKIVDQYDSLFSHDYNPFYLRRCNILVNKGLISMSEAINYLKSAYTEFDTHGLNEFEIDDNINRKSGK